MKRELTDRVFSFYTHAAGLVVKLHTREATYLVSHERADFVEVAAQVAAAWRSQQPVRVVVEPSLEIVSVTRIEAASA